MDTCKRMWSKDELTAAGSKYYQHNLVLTLTNENKTRSVGFLSSNPERITDVTVLNNEIKKIKRAYGVTCYTDSTGVTAYLMLPWTNELRFYCSAYEGKDTVASISADTVVEL